MSYLPTLPVKTRHLLISGISINAAGTDVATFTGLPAKYRLTRVMLFDVSTSLALSMATVGLFTAAGGGGSTVVTAALITSLTGATKFTDMTMAVSADYLTAATLYLRNVVAHGSAATLSALIEYIDLT